MAAHLVVEEVVALIFIGLAVTATVIALVYATREFFAGRDDIRFNTDPVDAQMSRMNLTRAIGYYIIGATGLTLSAILTWRVVQGPQTGTQVIGAIVLCVQAVGLLFVARGEYEGRRRIQRLSDRN